MIKVDSTLGKDDTSAQKVKNKDKLLNFLETHCLRRNYMFSVKKKAIRWSVTFVNPPDYFPMSSPHYTIYQTQNRMESIMSHLRKCMVK